MFENRAKGFLSDEKIVEQVNLKGCVKRSGEPMTVKYMQSLIKKPIYAGIKLTKWTGKAIKLPYE